MIGRTLPALTFCVLQISGASAEERTGLAHRMSCTVVRYYVAKYTEPVAEAWARDKGATEAEIEAARRCLAKGADQALQAASLSAHEPANAP